jgi:hypothetical protein
MFSNRHYALLLTVTIAALLGNLPRLAAQVQVEDQQRGLIPNGPWRIAGTVVNANNGVPLARARITIMDTRARQNVQAVVSSDSGRFEFHVPAGKFGLQGAKRGFITSAFQQHEFFSSAIVTGSPGVDSENLILRLPPNAVLTGKVTDEFGEPARQAQIMVYREDRTSGVSRIRRFRGTVTDDQGRYEVTPIEAGTYFVSVKSTPWYAVHPSSAGEGASAPIQVDPALDAAYPLTFYGDTIEADEATPIPVRGGDRLDADIHLNPLPALHLTFHGGDNGAAIAYPQLQKPVFDEVEEVDNGNVEMVSPGVFELTGIAAGKYLVRMPDSNGQLKEPAATNLAGSQELNSTQGNSTAGIALKVVMEGGGAIPSQAWIGLRNSKDNVAGSLIDASGEASFSDLIPGKYDVVAGSQTENFTVTQVTWDGGRNEGRTVNLTAGTTLSVTASLLVGSVQVEGVAKRDGKPFAGAMVVLIPENPEQNVDRFRRDQSDLDGTFTLLNVNPGSYTVIAIEDGWDLDWAKPVVLAHYGRSGQPLVVRPNAKGTLNLSAPVAVVRK